MMFEQIKLYFLLRQALSKEGRGAMIANILKNWKTSLLGSIGGITLLLKGLATSDTTLVITGISTMLMGLLAKDGNVTGVA